MNHLLFAALAAILAVQSNVTITRLEEPVKMKETVVGNVTTVEWRYGWAECEVTKQDGKFVSGRVLRIVYSEQEPTNFAHEALHSISCTHSGGVGGLLPFPAKTADPEHEFVYWCLAHENDCIALIEKTVAAR